MEKGALSPEKSYFARAFFLSILLCNENSNDFKSKIIHGCP